MFLQKKSQYFARY